MNPCDACDLLVGNQYTGRYNADCRACEKRMLASMPEQRREAYLADQQAEKKPEAES